MRSKFPGKNGKDMKSARSRGTNGGTFGESEENIVRTDVIELSFQSKGDVESREEAKEEGSGNGEGGSGRVKRSFSRTRNRGDSNERAAADKLDKETTEWHGAKGQYGHRVEIRREE